MTNTATQLLVQYSVPELLSVMLGSLNDKPLVDATFVSLSFLAARLKVAGVKTVKASATGQRGRSYLSAGASLGQTVALRPLLLPSSKFQVPGSASSSRTNKAGRT